MMEHKVQVKEVFGGWAWVCKCGAKEGFPPYVRKEHAVKAGKDHIVRSS